jgi:D-hydroxyproline dehydrogenase subunit alpha
MISCDVLVVGAGPAGMAAAVAAGSAGCRVVMLDDNASPGGQIWRGAAATHGSSHPGSARFSHLLRQLTGMSVEVLSGTRVIDQPTPGVLRVETDSASALVEYKRLILATGARERFLPFPGWTLPGVLGAGGLQAMVKSGLPIAGKRVVLAGSGPLLLAVAAYLRKSGAQIAGIFEQAPMTRLTRFAAGLIAHPSKLAEAFRFRAASFGVPYRTSSWITRAHGEQSLRAVTIIANSKPLDIPCDYLGVGFHLVPNLELPALLGCAIAQDRVPVDEEQQSTVPSVYCVGELTGVGGLEKALVEGEIAGLAAAGQSARHLYRRRDTYASFARHLDAAFALRPELRSLPSAETIVCRCEDVPLHALHSMRNGREARLYTRCGMGPCQARICGPATEFIFGWSTAAARPPMTPARVETLADSPAHPFAISQS